MLSRCNNQCKGPKPGLRKFLWPFLVSVGADEPYLLGGYNAALFYQL